MEDYKNKPLIVPNMTDEIRALLEKIKETNVDESVTFKDSCLKVNSLVDGASDAAKASLQFFKKEDCSKNVLEQFIERQKQQASN
jgi:hypothetical protein